MQFGIIAIHGGYIEPGTDVVARAIAGGDFPLYVNTEGEHVKSVEFTNPEIEKFLIEVDTAVSIHGEHSEDESFVMIGGLHTELRNKIINELEKTGFKTKEPKDDLNGDDPRNICNRGRSGMGVQLELSHKLRDGLIGDPGLLIRFSDAIRSVL